MAKKPVSNKSSKSTSKTSIQKVTATSKFAPKKPVPKKQQKNPSITLKY